MFIASAPGVGFTNILHAAFMRVDHISANKTVKSSVILCFWDQGA